MSEPPVLIAGMVPRLALSYKVLFDIARTSASSFTVMSRFIDSSRSVIDCRSAIHGTRHA